MRLTNNIFIINYDVMKICIYDNDSLHNVVLFVTIFL